MKYRVHCAKCGTEMQVKKWDLLRNLFCGRACTVAGRGLTIPDERFDVMTMVDSGEFEIAPMKQTRRNGLLAEVPRPRTWWGA